MKLGTTGITTDQIAREVKRIYGVSLDRLPVAEQTIARYAAIARIRSRGGK